MAGRVGPGGKPSSALTVVRPWAAKVSLCLDFPICKMIRVATHNREELRGMRRCNETIANKVPSPVSVASRLVTGGHLPSSPPVLQAGAPSQPQLSTTRMSGCNMGLACGFHKDDRPYTEFSPGMRTLRRTYPSHAFSGTISV